MTWQREHLERQERIVRALEHGTITEDAAEALDVIDNNLRHRWCLLASLAPQLGRGTIADDGVQYVMVVTKEANQ